MRRAGLARAYVIQSSSILCNRSIADFGLSFGASFSQPKSPLTGFLVKTIAIAAGALLLAQGVFAGEVSAQVLEIGDDGV